jgi:hypothetical protein
MIIAILGWGSLIWDPRNLQIDTTKGDNGWLTDGPMLSIEFARISNDGRLTLVIAPEEKNEVKILYAFSKYENLDEAILDLAVRENCGKNKVVVYLKSEHQFSDNFHTPKFEKSRASIKEWANHQSADAIIWTNLSSNYKDKLYLEKFTPLDAVNYLKYLPSDIKAKAEEYVRKTPEAINTPIRKEIEKQLNWAKIKI